MRGSRTPNGRRGSIRRSRTSWPMFQVFNTWKGDTVFIEGMRKTVIEMLERVKVSDACGSGRGAQQLYAALTRATKTDGGGMRVL